VRPFHGPADRPGEHAEDRAVRLGEILPRPVQRHPHEHAVTGRQSEADLVLDPDRPEEVRVEAEPVELLLAEQIADLDRLVVAGLVDVVDQRMLVHVGHERGRVGLGQPAGRVFGDPQLAAAGFEPDLVVDNHVTADQPGQPRQNQVIGPGRVVEVGQAVHELRRPPQHLERDVHAHHPPGC
jgi:hypothetical protein